MNPPAVHYTIAEQRMHPQELAAAMPTLELVCRALFAVGITQRELGKAITSAKAA